MITQEKKWKQDLSQGQTGERVIAKHFEDNYSLTEILFNDDYKFDISGKRGDEIITFEVKTDRYEFMKEIKTYNMFIEISCNGKPSGISNSKADHFVYYYPDFEEAFIIPMAKLRVLIMMEELKLTEQSGDGGKVNGYLIHRNLYRHHFNVIKITKNTEIWGE